MTEREAPSDPGFDFWSDDHGAPGESALTSALPWYRTKPAAAALLVAAAVVVAAPIVVFTSRAGTLPRPAQPAAVLPPASTSTEPTPGSVGTPITLLSTAPPPPSAEDTSRARTPRRSPATRQPAHKSTTAAPTPITPITRAPISVAPVPRQPPQNNLATPGRKP